MQDGGGGAQWALVDQLQQENNAMELENTRVKIQLVGNCARGGMCEVPL